MSVQLFKKLESSFTQGICVKCLKKPQVSVGYGRFRALCWRCHDIRVGRNPAARKKKYTLTKKAKCGKCGFVPEHKCQLDVDHIDGNRENNDIDNLQTLCANCHRLKTYLNKEWGGK
jgi:hypothetical protein